jgi:hypothetical protein
VVIMDLEVAREHLEQCAPHTKDPSRLDANGQAVF